jgi:hypothetical protein
MLQLEDEYEEIEEVNPEGRWGPNKTITYKRPITSSTQASNSFQLKKRVPHPLPQSSFALRKDTMKEALAEKVMEETAGGSKGGITMSDARARADQALARATRGNTGNK